MMTKVIGSLCEQDCFHPYECNHDDTCPHCTLAVFKGHDPQKCALCSEFKDDEGNPAKLVNMPYREINPPLTPKMMSDSSRKIFNASHPEGRKKFSQERRLARLQKKLAKKKWVTNPSTFNIGLGVRYVPLNSLCLDKNALFGAGIVTKSTASEEERYYAGCRMRALG